MNSSFFDVIAKNDIDELGKALQGLDKGATFKIKFPKNNPETDQFSSDNLTLAHVAAYYNSTECLYFLIKYCGFSFKALSSKEFTPFHYACFGGAAECAYILADMYEDELQGSFLAFLSQDYKKAEMNLPYLATLSSSTEILNLIFSKGYDFEKYQPENKKFANKGIDFAIKKKDIKCLIILLRNRKPSKNVDDKTPLMLAVINGQNAAVKLLLENECHANAMTKDKETALTFACIQQNVDAVRMLTDVMTEIDIPKTEKVAAAVHWACQSKNPTIVELILSKGVDVNRLDKQDRNAVHRLEDHANEDETIQILKLLIDHGFNINPRKPNEKSLLEMFLTCISKRLKVVRWLLEEGADVNAMMVTAKKGKTVAQFIQEMPYNPVLEQIKKDYHDILSGKK